MYKEVKGDLIKLAVAGEFNVIGHGCNCFCAQGAGIAPKMVRAFDTNNPKKYFLEDMDHKGDITKLGSFQAYSYYMIVDGDRKRLDVLNIYSQYHYGKNHKDGVKNPLDYEALTIALRKINHRYKGKHIGLPQIGCGLAGGDWAKVKTIIQNELKDCDVTVVIYEK